MMDKQPVKYRTLLFLSAGFLCLQLGAGIFMLRSVREEPLPMADVNELVQSVSGQWEELRAGKRPSLPEAAADWAFSLADADGTLLFTYGEGAPGSVHEAVAERDTLVDVPGPEGETAGKLLLHNGMGARMAALNGRLTVLLAAVSVLELLLLAGYLLWLDRRFLRPFGKLREFAVRVAGGDLDFPLAMDRENVFGAFTESFDLMREELKRAREQERAAQESKKELVAKLSHDIKTPVASIQAVSELMALSATAPKEQEQLRIIREKAGQIDSLITDLFQASLEELRELPVNPVWHDSAGLARLLSCADYQGLARIGEIPACMVLYDEQRLQQVLDNLFANAYKYAGGSMQVSFAFSQTCLQILTQDEGPGVPEEELPFLTRKYYRGKNAEGKSGVGLGLFISRYLLERMGGTLVCRNTERGFLAEVSLATEEPRFPA